jgi:hypothetical protein
MTDVERLLEHQAATGQFGEIPAMDGVTKPMKIVKMTRIPDRKITVEGIDKDGKEHTVTVGY